MPRGDARFSRSVSLAPPTFLTIGRAISGKRASTDFEGLAPTFAANGQRPARAIAGDPAARLQQRNSPSPTNKEKGREKMNSAIFIAALSAGLTIHMQQPSSPQGADHHHAAQQEQSP
jgi:hypothetical protein